MGSGRILPSTVHSPSAETWQYFPDGSGYRNNGYKQVTLADIALPAETILIGEKHNADLINRGRDGHGIQGNRHSRVSTGWTVGLDPVRPPMRTLRHPWPERQERNGYSRAQRYVKLCVRGRSRKSHETGTNEPRYMGAATEKHVGCFPEVTDYESEKVCNGNCCVRLVLLSIGTTGCGEKRHPQYKKVPGAKFVPATPPPGYVEQQMAKRNQGRNPARSGNETRALRGTCAGNGQESTRFVQDEAGALFYNDCRSKSGGEYAHRITDTDVSRSGDSELRTRAHAPTKPRRYAMR
jgi:hypothetical protein